MAKKNQKNKQKKSGTKRSGKKVTVQSQPKHKGRAQKFDLDVGGTYRQTLTSVEGSGRAKMSVSAIPAATTECMRPYFTVGKGSLKDSMRVQGLEVLHDGAFDPATYPGGPVVASSIHKVFPVNPITIASSRLRDLSLLYTKYIFRSVRLHWVPRAAIVNTHNAGELMISFERDADSALAPGSMINYEDMFAREGSVASAVYSGFTATYKPNDPQLTYYVSGNVSDADPRLEQQAYAYLIAGTLFQENLSDGDGYGRFYVEYDIELFAPRTDSVTSGIFWAESQAVTSITLPFGANPVQASSPYARVKVVDGDTLLTIGASHSGLLFIQSTLAGPHVPTTAIYGVRINASAITGTGTLTALLNGTVEQPESETEPVEYGAYVQYYVSAHTDYSLSISANQNGTTPASNAAFAGCLSKLFFIPSTMLMPAVTIEQTSMGRLRSVRPFDFTFGMKPAKIAPIPQSDSSFDDAELVDDAAPLMRDLLRAYHAMRVVKT